MPTLAINEQGAHIHIEGDLLVIRKASQVLTRVRLAEVDQLVLIGRVELSSAALAALARRKVDVVFLSSKGYFRARLLGRGSRHVTLRLLQHRRALEPAFAVGFARALVSAKIAHQRQLLLRAQRRLQDADLADVLGRLRLLVDQLAREDDLERIRGLEGRAAALYFSQLGKLLLTNELAFHGRSRRPPRDPVNAGLSFGYTLLGTVVEAELLRAGLDPLVGFFHQPLDGRSSLMLDLLEEFRPFIDALVLRLINRRQLGPADFEQHGGPALEEILAETPPEEPADQAPAANQPPLGIYLGETGRRIFLTEFYRRLHERLFYPPRQGSFELRDIIREQAYHLARVIAGEDTTYIPFVPG